MHNSNAVDVFYTVYEFMEHATGFFLVDPFPHHDVVEQLALFHVLHHKE